MDLERTLRAALARRGVVLREAEIVPHVDLDGFSALVLHFEGQAPVFDVMSGGYDFGNAGDIECWVYCHYGVATLAEESVLAMAGAR